MKLPYQNKNLWRWRWMQNWESRRLHRIRWSGKHLRKYAVKTIQAETVCGLRGEYHMPGMFSRLGALRCGECCDKLGIKRGFGAPFNDGINA